MSDLLLRELSVAAFDCPVITSGHEDYDRYRKVWNGVADRRPAAIVRARGLEDVRKAVVAAARARTLLAVRGGGHSLPGLSTCDDGLVLDLAQLNDVVVDQEAQTVEVGGGALLRDLDQATIPLGYVVPAGVISHTGVAGLTLGGGMGWASRKYGLTIDSLLGAELVTADGNRIWTSRTSDPELFWGIRGGGGNFGVVTRFKFRMHPFGSIVAGQWNYEFGRTAQALRTLRDLARERPRDFTVTLTATASGLGVAAVWLGDERLADAMLSPLGELAGAGTGTIGPMPYLKLQSRNDEHFASSRRYYAKGGFWRDIGDEAIAHIVDVVARAPTPDCEIFAVQLGGAVCDISDAATAYTGRNAGYYWLSEPVWDDPADDEACLAWGRAAARSLSDPSMEGNYVNELGDAGADVAREAYGTEKYQRLARLKARLDPDNLFRLNQNIKPAGTAAV
ncbi:FAD-binding oxidoreductase [Rhizobium sp. BK251]|uniref:FAD-binding oxidoreductase n=1 Tax=Rhizobium sp. BK251 TaxID=2512125 RepID=UPI001050267E|nr:FAD-binding oxidoreductase [Rhizobium sp. BK251]TCL73603.1 FAD/FMN-containing dehydrogenase [Rhizobium sp. BK251]